MLSKELAEEIKKKIWQNYLDSNLGEDLAVAFKMATDAIFSFVEEEAEHA